MKTKTLLASLIVAGVAASSQAAIITFLENGSNVALGTTSTFTSGGASIQAWASSGNLFAKDQGAGEQGLGLTTDPSGQNEISGNDFVQIFTLGGLNALTIDLGSTSGGEIANIYASSTQGVLGSLIGSLNADGTFNVPLAYQTSYLSVKAGGSTQSGNPNVLLGAVSVNGRTTPDGGTTMILLGSALSAASLIRRKLIA